VDGGSAEAGGAGEEWKLVVEVVGLGKGYAPTGNDECSSFNFHDCRIGSSRTAAQQVRV